MSARATASGSWSWSRPELHAGQSGVEDVILDTNKAYLKFSVKAHLQKSSAIAPLKGFFNGNSDGHHFPILVVGLFKRIEVVNIWDTEWAQIEMIQLVPDFNWPPDREKAITIRGSIPSSVRISWVMGSAIAGYVDYFNGTCSYPWVECAAGCCTTTDHSAVVATNVTFEITPAQ